MRVFIVCSLEGGSVAEFILMLILLLGRVEPKI